MPWLGSAICLVACVPAAPPSSTASVTIDATDASAPTSAPEAGVTTAALVERWNSDHSPRSVEELAAIYAPSILFYDVELSGSDAVARKRTALTKTPDYHQSLRDVEVSPIDANGGTFVRFTKATTSNGVTKSFPGYLYVLDGRVAAEGDRVVDAEPGTYGTYCYGGPPSAPPNDVRAGEIPMSGLEAKIIARFSKAFATLSRPAKLELRDCAHGCRPIDGTTCKGDEITPFQFVAVGPGGRDAGWVAVDVEPRTVTAGR